MIEVCIPLETLERHHEVMRGFLIVEKLKAAGIPVDGSLTVGGVLHGSLTTFDNVLFGDRVWRWTEDTPI